MHAAQSESALWPTSQARWSHVPDPTRIFTFVAHLFYLPPSYLKATWLSRPPSLSLPSTPRGLPGIPKGPAMASQGFPRATQGTHKDRLRAPRGHPRPPKSPQGPPRLPPRGPQEPRAAQKTPKGGPGEGCVHKICIF